MNSLFLRKFSVFESLGPSSCPLQMASAWVWGCVQTPQWSWVGIDVDKKKYGLLPGFCEVRLLWSAPRTSDCELSLGDTPMGLQLPWERLHSPWSSETPTILIWMFLQSSPLPLVGSWWVKDLNWERKTAKEHWHLISLLVLSPLPLKLLGPKEVNFYFPMFFFFSFCQSFPLTPLPSLQICDSTPGPNEGRKKPIKDHVIEAGKISVPLQIHKHFSMCPR